MGHIVSHKATCDVASSDMSCRFGRALEGDCRRHVVSPGCLVVRHPSRVLSPISARDSVILRDMRGVDPKSVGHGGPSGCDTPCRMVVACKRRRVTQEATSRALHRPTKRHPLSLRCDIHGSPCDIEPLPMRHRGSCVASERRASRSARRAVLANAPPPQPTAPRTSRLPHHAGSSGRTLRRPGPRSVPPAVAARLREGPPRRRCVRPGRRRRSSREPGSSGLTAIGPIGERATAGRRARVRQPRVAASWTGGPEERGEGAEPRDFKDLPLAPDLARRMLKEKCEGVCPPPAGAGRAS
jgi:hypothetical protein